MRCCKEKFEIKKFWQPQRDITKKSAVELLLHGFPVVFFYGCEEFIISGSRLSYLDTQSGRNILSRRDRSFHVPNNHAGSGIDIIGCGYQNLEFALHGEDLGRGNAHSPARDIDGNAHLFKTILADIDQQAFVYSFFSSFGHGCTPKKIGKRSQYKIYKAKHMPSAE
jgi:hypothetical protein